MSEHGKIFSECPSCGNAAVTFQEVDRSFPYGASPNQVELHMRVPVGTCAECGLEFTDRRAERLEHEAVCTHLDLLTPSQIEGLRKMWGMSRQQFAELTKIGEASLSRWERYAGFQNPALDQLLYLLSFSDNMRRLRTRPENSHMIATLAKASDDPTCVTMRFPNLKKPAEKQSEARVFQLRTGT